MIGHEVAGRTCTQCGVWKARVDFYLDSDGVHGLFSWCKDCSRAQVRSRRAADPEKTRLQSKWSKYRIDFNELWERQKGLCALCRKPMQPKGAGPLSAAVDHDHNCCSGYKSCGACVRGLLHQRCNQILGYARENAVILNRAVAYLEKHRKALT